jgi:16S rRNA (cytidine1402-2'-O)-methyltransferase
MPGTLFVVATPIGNLEDVTLRALRLLREVALIAAEDTRRTSRLLQHYSISTPTTSLHEHNERTKGAALVQRLLAGQSIALVSDAGTPGISDPGARVVALAREAGIRVEPVPGANAALAALSASGFDVDEFLFVGFPPSRSTARKKWLERLKDEPRLLLFYEAPHRIRETLEAMLAVFGDRQLLVARELTKAHEELVLRPISGHLAALAAGRGEYTLVLAGPGVPAVIGQTPNREVIAREFGELTDNDGMARREAIKALALRYSIPSRDVYLIVEAAKHSGE